MAGPSYLVVEGVIGVGKTTLVERLSDALGARVVKEEFEENPFLPAFYEDQSAHALSTQLFFLMSRFRQQERLAQPELFTPITVSDYLFDKDRIFADLTLGEAERGIYDRLFSVLGPQVPRPDLVIYLRAGLDQILSRIRERGRSYEQAIDPGYLEALGGAYERFFGQYRAAPVVVVDTAEVDLREDGPVFRDLVEIARGGPLPGRALGSGAAPRLPGF